MEAVALASLRFPSSSFSSPSLSPQQPLAPSFSLSFNSLSSKQPLHLSSTTRRKKERSGAALKVRSSSDESASSSLERWLLEPVGDGDSRHIGSKVPLPGAFEIASNVVTVGRLPEKADIVIPVATDWSEFPDHNQQVHDHGFQSETVSGVHARLKKKDGNLLITDLDSTNGTFVDETRLRPGAVVTVPPGSCVTFGDTHLAMFRVSKVEAAAESPVTEEEEEEEEEESGIKLDTDVPNDNLETVS